jgi:DNA (cytosine-5)-methyltransferase 1
VKQASDGDSSIVLGGWYYDPRLSVWLNHDARGHMSSDLQRYAYASGYAKAYRRSPKGHLEFALAGLRPNHENWETGKFADRFRVQAKHRVATTITSHISKDGHYFIHYDPCQCRSLTVREAARLQTFPDNYFFQGNRTEQFHQVGNAVPPLLAKKIGELVFGLLRSGSTIAAPGAASQSVPSLVV